MSKTTLFINSLARKKFFGLPPEALAKYGLPPEALAKDGLPPETLAKYGLPPEFLAKYGLPPEALAKSGLPPEALAKSGLPPEALAKGGASKVLRQLKLPRLATLRVLAPLPQKSKTALTDGFKIFGASKGARTLDLNLGKVAL